MTVATNKRQYVDAFLIKYGANVNPQFSALGYGTAADQSKNVGAEAAQTQYFEARTARTRTATAQPEASRSARAVRWYTFAHGNANLLT
jgi:hypothetical protein